MKDTFDVSCGVIEVTSLHRPDEGWRHVDAAGHEHYWHEVGESAFKPMTSYSPMKHYLALSLIWVKDGEEYWPGDDEPHDVGHHECKQCGEHVEPGYKADDCVQLIPGLKRFWVNGINVTEEEFKRRAKEAGYNV